MPSDANGTDWLPIREVTRQTGVHPVTLRAWERRYGLIVPHRTAKGHRLYDSAQIARIHHVLTWLNRGVAVSQVKQLLDAPRDARPQVQNDWQQLRQTLAQAISDMAERPLDDLFNQAMALYPPATLCEQLLLPLLNDLEQRWAGQFGAQMEKVFFYGWLRSKLGTRIYHNNRQLDSAPVVLVNQADVTPDPYLWLGAWLVSSSDCPVQVFDAPLPAGELALACDKLQARALMVYADKALNLATLGRLLVGCACPKWLVGSAVLIHRAATGDSPPPMADLNLATDPLHAQQSLQASGVLADRQPEFER
jgi:DNA-binding transcriptional MerR regulator